MTILRRRRQNPFFDPALVQESVLLAAAAAPPSSRRAFENEKDAVYEIEDGDERETAFHDLDRRWFERFQIAAPFLEALAEHPSLEEKTARAFVILARSSKDEGADLHENRDVSSNDGRPVLVVRLRARTLLHRESLLALLRHELLYVADMIDPEFGYEPSLPPTEGGPTRERLVSERYRTLWSTTVDGRLAARGLLPPEAKNRRKREFLRVFPMLSFAEEEHFERFFHGPRPRHAELVAFAARPGDGESAAEAPANLCPLCRLPTVVFHPAPEQLGASALAILKAEFPQWEPQQGLCQHCGDLFQSRVQLEGETREER